MIRLPLLTAAATLAIAVPAAAAPSNPASGVCPMRIDGIQGGKLTVGVDIDDADSTAARKARCGQARKVVRTLVREGAEMPMRANGYRCTPRVTGQRLRWTCTYRGGEPRTRVVLRFAYRLA